MHIILVQLSMAKGQSVAYIVIDANYVVMCSDDGRIGVSINVVSYLLNLMFANSLKKFG